MSEQLAEAQRTPGPWTLVKCNCGHPSCNRYGVSAGMFPQGAGFDLADAQLVAAAPDLLAALRDARRELAALASSQSSMDACETAEAAIAKAEGRS